MFQKGRGGGRSGCTIIFLNKKFAEKAPFLLSEAGSGKVRYFLNSSLVDLPCLDVLDLGLGQVLHDAD